MEQLKKIMLDIKELNLKEENMYRITYENTET